MFSLTPFQYLNTLWIVMKSGEDVDVPQRNRLFVISWCFLHHEVDILTSAKVCFPSAFVCYLQDYAKKNDSASMTVCGGLEFDPRKNAFNVVADQDPAIPAFFLFTFCKISFFNIPQRSTHGSWWEIISANLFVTEIHWTVSIGSMNIGSEWGLF